LRHAAAEGMQLSVRRAIVEEPVGAHEEHLAVRSHCGPRDGDAIRHSRGKLGVLTLQQTILSLQDAAIPVFKQRLRRDPLIVGRGSDRWSGGSSRRRDSTDRRIHSGPYIRTGRARRDGGGWDNGGSG
jgi:hypothetical protein